MARNATFLFCLCICSLLLFSCEKDENFSIKKIQVSSDAVTVDSVTIALKNRFILHAPDSLSKDSIVIGKIMPVVAANKNDTRLAFYDTYYHRFLITNLEGTILHTFGREGRGPKEFGNVVSFGFDEKNNLIAYDGKLDLFKFFDSNGTYIKSIAGPYQDGIAPFPGRLYGRNGTIYFPMIKMEFYGDKQWRSPVVAGYGYNGGLKRLIGRTIPAIYDIKTQQHYPVISLNGAELYYADASNFLIFNVSLDDPRDIQYFGTQPDHFSFIDKPVKQHEDIRERARQYLHQSITHSLYRAEQFIYFNYTNSIPAYYKTWDFTKHKSYLVIYDRQTHSKLSEIKLPAYLALILKDGSLLLIESSDPDNFTLAHYEIQLHK